MTKPKGENIGPIEPQGQGQLSQDRLPSEPQSEPFQMIIDMDQPPDATAPQLLSLNEPEDPPAYQDALGGVKLPIGVAIADMSDDPYAVDKNIDVGAGAGGFYVDDTSSDTDFQQESVLNNWPDSPGNPSELVEQSSDEYDDDIGDEEDEVDDDDADDVYSDDAGDMDDMHEIQGTNDSVYNHTVHPGSYLKSRRHPEHHRMNRGRSSALRKKPVRLRLRGLSTNSRAIAGSPDTELISSQNTISEPASEEQLFVQQCNEITRSLHQSQSQQGVEIVKSMIEHDIEWRKTGELPTACPFTADQRHTLENTFFGAWAKLLVEQRSNPQNASTVLYLQDFVRLGCLILEQDSSLPDLYAQVLSAMFEQEDLAIYKRNPKRPSRLAHMARFQEYSSEYGPEDDEVPQLQQELQKTFCSMGGVDICIKSIEDQLDGTDNPDLKIRNLHLLLGLISGVQVTGNAEQSQAMRVSDLTKRLTTAVSGFFSEHMDSFRSANKATVLGIITHVGNFLLENYRLQSPFFNVVQETDPDYEEFDLHDPISRSNLGEVKFADFRLDMAVRLMKTSRLDLRLAGLVELKEVLVRIQRLQHNRSRLRRRSDSEMDVQMEQDRAPIEHMCSKLQSLQIVGHIFGSNIHLEIVQRSTDVLAFMMQAKVLTISDIDLIWAAVGGNQHRSIVYGVYQVLGELCNKLPQDFLRNLFNKLQAVPLESWDQQLVDLARSLFHAMVQRTKYNAEEGPISLIPYETLLNVLRNSTLQLNARDDPSFGATPPVGKDVISGIAQLLTEGLGVGPLPKDRATLVDYCIRDLKSNHPGAIWSLQVVQNIFELQFMNNEKGSLQFYKQTCSSLLDLFISNLKAYAAAVKALPLTPSPTMSSFAPLSTHHQAQEFWRSLQLKMRLDFLRAMTRIHSSYWNSPKLADTIWNSLIMDPIGIQEQDEAFTCLESMTEATFVEYVYEKLLPGLDVATISQKGWQCVKQYFLLVNWHQQSLTAKADPLAQGSQVIVVLAPLHGMEFVWKIALHAQFSAVGTHAIELLSSLIKSHIGQDDPVAHEAIYKFREGLVETCIGHLVESSDLLSKGDTGTMPDVSLVFERCIGILNAFLVACNSESSDGAVRREIHGCLDEDAMLTIKINSNLPLFQLSVHPSNTLGSLRRMVGAKLSCPEPEEVRLFVLGKDLIQGWDNRTLEELQIENGQTLLASRRPQMTATRHNTETTKPVPTDLLLKPDFFEMVRKIFLLDEIYASQAWEIITRLPTSPVLLHSLEELQGDVDWTTLLDARSPFLLLYSLQILDSLIKRDQATESPAKQLWIRRFFALGGQQYLTTLLMSESGLGAENSSPTARKALSLMLKVLVRLTNSADIESSMTTETSGLTVPVFLNKLVAEILTSATRDSGHNSNDQSIVLNATSLISYLCAGPHGWRYFHASPDIRSLLYVSMVQSDSMQIRQTVLQMGTKFCLQKEIQSSDVSPVIFFLDILQSFLPISKEYGSNCSELFDFFEIVAREAIQHCTKDYYSALYSRLMETIVNHPPSEGPSSPREDTVLIGMLKVATAMISSDSSLKQLPNVSNVIDYIFDECLFPHILTDDQSIGSATPAAPKCQSEGSRAAAFGYLEESAKGNPWALRHIVMKTHRHFERESEIEDQWGYDPQTVKRANCGYVGLQNLGATCYVNSIIQQFFMNTAFRYGILDAPAMEGSLDKQDTLLYQLQVLFGNLQESQRRAYNAYGFCYAYKDWDGNPMNVAVQMDVDEFFNILFDRLESSVKNTPQENLFKQQYGGKLVQQIKSKDCEHISEREDSFFSIQCEVKNKKTLEESLQLYVQGEILDGDNKYKCSSCDKHVDAIKRACIKELPRNLILHLKRFDYDMDTMRRIKINDHFEFPTRLDMEPYTLDYLTRKEQAQEGACTSPSSYFSGAKENTAAFQYNLVGVLVHTGTADSGHYYSYIKDRNPDTSICGSPSASPNCENARWYHFNDSKVEEFEASEIPAKAFGGMEFLPQDSSPYMKTPPRATTKPYSAYMLFYERANTVALETPQTTSGEVPKDIKDIVVKENSALLKDLSVFDRLYYRFVWDLFNMYRSIPEQIEQLDSTKGSKEPLNHLSMEYGLDFFFSVLIHARDVDQELQQWSRFLVSLLALYPVGCAKFLHGLARNQTLLSSILLSCPITQVREAVIDLIYEALHVLREQDKAMYGLAANSVTSEVFGRSSDLKDDDDSWHCSRGSMIHCFIRSLLSLLPEARANWRNFDEYFKLMYNITQLGRAERALMAREGHLAELIEFYVADEKGDVKKKKMGDKFTKPAFHYLLLTVQEVLTTCDISRSYESFQRRSPADTTMRRTSSSASSESVTSAHSSLISDEVVMDDDTLVPSVSPELEPSVLLSPADFNALFYVHGSLGTAAEKSLLLITKMLQDRIDSPIIAGIVAHLSSHAEISRRVLESLAACLGYASEDQFTSIIHVFMEIAQLVDDQSESRVEFIVTQLLKILDQSPPSSVAYDCLEFFRTISDYGQCGRFVQSLLLRHTKLWLQELLLVQGDSDTRMRARQFYMELLSSERAFNGWNDEQAAAASAQHFARLLELLRVVSDLMLYYPTQSRRDDDESDWRFVEYFRLLTQLVHGDTERDLFFQWWMLFIEIATKVDAQQRVMDYDKKEMMVFWNRIMVDNHERDARLASFKPLGILLRKFYVCLQHSAINVQFHREILPIYFGLVLRFCRVLPAFHLEWAHCHNYTWAIKEMKWGDYLDHCPEELDQLLQYTLSEFPQYRHECWRMLPSVDTPRFSDAFIRIARVTFAPENELAGTLFYQRRGMIHLTDVMKAADLSGTVTGDHEFFAVEALGLLRDYLCHMFICRNTPAFAEAMDHWSNIDVAITLLTENLMWTAPPHVYADSIKVLEVIAQEATYTQSALLVQILDKAHCQWRDSLDAGVLTQGQASLVAMDQLPAGSLMHLEFLCEASEAAAGNEDMMLALQNPYLAVFMKQFLNRAKFLSALTESHLKLCATLLRCISGNIESSLLIAVGDECRARVEKILSHQGLAEQDQNDQSMSDPSDMTPADEKMTEKDAQDLITSLQTLSILEIAGQVVGAAQLDQLRQLEIRIISVVSRVPDQYVSAFSNLPITASSALDAASNSGSANGATVEATTAAIETIEKDQNGDTTSLKMDEESTMMSGIVQETTADDTGAEGKSSEIALKEGGV
ncbi:hypothetical protein BG011_005045 [Mortierella polycephala]|uniref:ubiquitinyl hydrolase 1 n=1 Tax=Mortierella polycephala TaxID=41804 RepID=A0A9P6PWN7_9FUNG|nr:hypothetical protein BG011_005045 [Mortierella polycephala]